MLFDHWCILFTLVFTHWLADFRLQTSWEAENKWNSNKALFSHTFTYATIFALVFGWKFGVVTFVCHTFTDMFSSPMTHARAERKEWHEFFEIVGIDQLAHLIQLGVTAHYLLGL